MNYILAKQRELLKLIANNYNNHNPCHIPNAYNGRVVDYIKEHSWYMNEEVNELILAVGDNDRAILKPWSTRYNAIAYGPFKSDADIREEAIDMLCFCMNICLAVGLTPENINEEYAKKWEKNIKRQSEGY
jgi:NTP pyrophosphatase (non-canonical NTP hydrolase)